MCFSWKFLTLFNTYSIRREFHYIVYLKQILLSEIYLGTLLLKIWNQNIIFCVHQYNYFCWVCHLHRTPKMHLFNFHCTRISLVRTENLAPWPRWTILPSKSQLSAKPSPQLDVPTRPHCVFGLGRPDQTHHQVAINWHLCSSPHWCVQHMWTQINWLTCPNLTCRPEVGSQQQLLYDLERPAGR